VPRTEQACDPDNSCGSAGWCLRAVVNDLQEETWAA